MVPEKPDIMLITTAILALAALGFGLLYLSINWFDKI